MCLISWKQFVAGYVLLAATPSFASHSCPSGAEPLHQVTPAGSVEACIDSTGQLHGTVVVRDHAGTLHRRALWSHGVKTGTWETYHANGEVASKAEYEDGVQHGLVTSWFPGGRMKNSTTFVKGVREGPIAEWDESGTQTVSGQFTAGQPSGVWSFHDAGAGSIYTRTFDAGQPVSTEALMTDTSCTSWTTSSPLVRTQFAADILAEMVSGSMQAPEIAKHVPISIKIANCTAERAPRFEAILDSRCQRGAHTPLSEDAAQAAVEIGRECVLR